MGSLHFLNCFLTGTFWVLASTWLPSNEDPPAAEEAAPAALAAPDAAPASQEAAPLVEEAVPAAEEPALKASGVHRGGFSKGGLAINQS